MKTTMNTKMNIKNEHGPEIENEDEIAKVNEHQNMKNESDSEQL